ncbi:atp4 subunit B of the stator stalk of mitochondrial F1F0 ATP synthase [Mycoemilia scoparia]|uniref:ATP synthase subunit 4 n=1 Tax=Mycoemilia scoparia TaxID=417184 RepID=A0A9W8AA06_9FUNG|nr:atp4 subunit B of the stator stalk of mitochondrial F1F0 ATP synthase [Mycoemilia scoparia]
MAYRQLAKSLSGISARPVVARVSPVTFNAIRTYASNASGKEPLEPAKKADSIISSLPGDSLIAKTGYIATGTGLAALLISKEIYVFNEESIIVAAFGAIVAIIYKAIKEPYRSWAQGHTIKNTLVQARADHKTSVQEQISAVAQLKDIVGTTKNLFGMSKELAKMKAEIFELNQKAAMSSEVKAVLDSWVRYEASVREQQQKQLAEKVISNVHAQLQDPKVQNSLIEQCLTDMSKAVKA